MLRPSINHSIQPRKVTAQQALNLVYTECALVQTIPSELGNDESWDYNFNQYLDPQHNRPVKNINTNSDRTLCLDPRTGLWSKREVKPIRGGSKETNNTKKKSTSLLPADGQMHLFDGSYCRVGILYDLNACDLNQQKYMFETNALTNLKWWIWGQGTDADLRRSVSLPQLRKNNRETRAAGKIPVWNEILASTSAAAIHAIFAPCDNLTTKLNAIHKKILLKEKLSLDVPILIITPNEPVKEYTPIQQIIDIFEAKNQSNTIARKFVDLIFNTQQKLSDFIKQNFDANSAGEIALLLARRGFWNDVYLLFDLFPNLATNWYDSNSGFYTLHYAIRDNQLSAAKELRTRNASISESANDANKKCTPLSMALEKRNIELVKALFKHGDFPKNLNADQIGQTLLLAAENSDWDFIIFLLDGYSCPQPYIQINLNLRTFSSGFTLLHHALANSKADVAKKICRKNPDIYADANGTTPLSLACKIKDISLVRTLIYETSISKIHPHNDEALLIAHKAHDYDLIRSLLKRGAKPTVYDMENNFYPLWEACIHPEINLLDDYMATKPSDMAHCHAVLKATIANKTDIVLKLLQHDVNTNLDSWAIAPEFSSAFHYAVKIDNPQIAAALFKRRANHQFLNMNDETPWSLAINGKKMAILEALLLEASDRITPEQTGKALELFMEKKLWTAITAIFCGYRSKIYNPKNSTTASRPYISQIPLETKQKLLTDSILQQEDKLTLALLESETMPITSEETIHCLNVLLKQEKCPSEILKKIYGSNLLPLENKISLYLWLAAQDSLVRKIGLNNTNSFDKDKVLAALRDKNNFLALNDNERGILLLASLHQDFAIGNIFRHARGRFKPSISRGTLKAIVIELQNLSGENLFEALAAQQESLTEDQIEALNTAEIKDKLFAHIENLPIEKRKICLTKAGTVNDNFYLIFNKTNLFRSAKEKEILAKIESESKKLGKTSIASFSFLYQNNSRLIFSESFFDLVERDAFSTTSSESPAARYSNPSL